MLNSVSGLNSFQFIFLVLFDRVKIHVVIGCEDEAELFAGSVHHEHVIPVVGG